MAKLARKNSDDAITDDGRMVMDGASGNNEETPDTMPSDMSNIEISIPELSKGVPDFLRLPRNRF